MVRCIDCFSERPSDSRHGKDATSGSLKLTIPQYCPSTKYVDTYTQI